ncbi:MAG: DPP IV N-terminal domain-containing protein, partial [Gemmatimonadaceae bacterium]|nr:DPP IV N-terminal domain-containing protein [Gemmatimonadaceae bacterium]
MSITIASMHAPRRRGTLARTQHLVLALTLIVPCEAIAAQTARTARTIAASTTAGTSASGSFSLEQILSYPYPEELTSSRSGARIAWVFNVRGVRNIWVAEGPDFKARQITDYRADDGQELTHLSLTSDGKYVVYARGGDHDANWSSEPQPDPSHSAVQPKVEVWVAPFAAGDGRKGAQLLSEGDEPVVSPRGDRVAFTKDHQIWIASPDSAGSAKRLFFVRGEIGSAVWSPSGDRLAFVTARTDHALIGVFTSDSAPITYLAPSTSTDGSPRWSPDGARIAFVRQPGTGGAPETLLELHPAPWELWIADATTGIGHRVWKSPHTLLGSMPSTQGEANLSWGAGDRLVFLTTLDGWAHLYSMPAAGGTPTLLTPGHFEVEYVAAAPGGGTIIYNANAGAARGDIDRRHLFSVPVDRASPTELTSGEGLEWDPHLTDDGRTIGFIGAGAQKSPLPMVLAVGGGAPRVIGEEVVPATFPASELVMPKPVVFRAADGTEVHGQLFERADAKGGAKQPGVIFVHGGPPRQMLLGWHYMNYYSNAYAVNQYLANHGYVVLAVNY